MNTRGQQALPHPPDIAIGTALVGSHGSVQEIQAAIRAFCGAIISDADQPNELPLPLTTVGDMPTGSASASPATASVAAIAHTRRGRANALANAVAQVEDLAAMPDGRAN